MAIADLRTPFPELVPVDPEKRNEAVFVSPDETLYAPDGLVASFRTVDEHYVADRDGRLKFMADSVFKGWTGGSMGMIVPVYGSLQFDERNIGSTELLVVTSPLNDGPPASTAEEMSRYVRNPDPDTTQIRIAQPNSWGPVTKLDTAYEFLNVEGANLPVLQVFSRVPPRALSLSERAQLWRHGDLDGYGRVVHEAIIRAHQELQLEGGPGIDKVHFFGAGMAHTAIAAARYVADKQDHYEIGSFTAMNLMLSEAGILRMGRDYSVHQHTGEASDIVLPPGYSRVPEPVMRREIDGKGAEFHMRWRQLRAMLDISYMLAARRPSPTVDNIEALMEEGVPGTIANAHNSSLTADTRGFLPIGDAGLNLIDIVGVEGKKVGMMSNEQAALVALIMGVGLRNGRPAAA